MQKRKWPRIEVFCLCVVSMAFSAVSHASFVGELVDIRLHDPVEPFDVTNLDVLVDASDGIVLERGDGSPIDAALGILQGTSIEFSTSGQSTLTFNLRGDGPSHPGDPDDPGAIYQMTGYSSEAYFELSGFSKSLLELFDVADSSLVGISRENAIGGAVLIDFALNTITLNLGTLGILDQGASDIGSITVGVVPIPASLPLMLSALAFLGFLSRRKKT